MKRHQGERQTVPEQQLTLYRRLEFDPFFRGTTWLGAAELGRKWVLTVEDWAEIRRLHRAEGMPIKAIVRTLGISRNTVRAALASDGPPKYQALGRKRT
jgi:hypothetical protein